MFENCEVLREKLMQKKGKGKQLPFWNKI